MIDGLKVALYLLLIAAGEIAVKALLILAGLFLLIWVLHRWRKRAVA